MVLLFVRKEHAISNSGQLLQRTTFAVVYIHVFVIMCIIMIYTILTSDFNNSFSSLSVNSAKH